ncbi:MAG: efflux RND transporter periplasmic adaptor subunit [Phycisphaerae bacterium]|nr:efflux RND transporter periplasmic adaptor subunit [Phycisphaerae bacterium]
MTRLTEPEILATRAQRSSIPGLQSVGPRREIPERPKPAPAAKRLSKLWLMLPLLLVAASACTWYLVHRYRASRIEPDVTYFEIDRMSFPVILTAKGEIKAKKNTEIRCEVEGRSTIVWLIEEGKQVKEGDLLVELANDGGGTGSSIDDRIKKEEIDTATAKAALENAQKNHEIQLDLNESNIRKARLTLELAELQLKKYVEGDAVQAEEAAKLAREEAKAVLDRREDDYTTSKQLFERGYITKTEHENDKFLEYKARLELQKAKLSEEIVTTYSHQLALRQMQSAMEEAKKDLERTIKRAEAEAAQSKANLEAKEALYGIQEDKLNKLKQQRENLKIHAPGPGMVVYHRSNRYWDTQRIEVGASVHERQAMIDLPDPSVMQVEVKINESQMDKLDSDLPVTVEVEGISGVRFTGQVTKLGVLADSQNRWLNPNLKEYTNEVTLDQTHADLKPGMSATAEILVTQLENVLAAPVQCVFTKGGHSYVFLANGDGGYKEVKLGLASTEYVEVIDGLQEGDKVCLAVTDEMKRTLPTDVASAEATKALQQIVTENAEKRGGKRDKRPGNPETPKRETPAKPEAARKNQPSVPGK